MFHACRTSTDIENSLSSKLDQIASWFNDNNLVINLKKSKNRMRSLWDTSKNVRCKQI